MKQDGEDRPGGGGGSGPPGQGATLKDAFEDAWRKVHHKDPQRWYVAQISVRGENPIREYRVVIGD